MKKKNFLLTCLTVFLLFAFVSLNSSVCYAVTLDDLSPKEKLQLQGFSVIGRENGDEAAYEYIVSLNGDFSPNVLQYIIDNGNDRARAIINKHVDDLKALGYTNVDYSAVTGSSNAAIPAQTQPAEPAKTPEPFTVETYNPAKTMWATQIVNCREGASTEYNKVGSLTEDEEVSVTGIASTGWYQITREDGTIVYVSEKYLTEKEPAKEEMVTETVSEATEESQIIEEEAIQEPTLEPTPEQTATPEPTIEPTMEPTQELTAVPVMESTVEDTTIKRDSSTPYIVAGIVGILVLVGTAIIVKKKKK